MNKINKYYKNILKEKKLKFSIFLLKSKIISKKLSLYKTEAVEILENSTHSNLRQKSSINIKSIPIFLVILGVLFAGQMFAQTTTSSQQTTLNQCAPVNGSGLSVWESCGFTPSLFQSGAIAILGNYTQASSSSTTGYNYTGGYGAFGEANSLVSSMYTTQPESGVGYFAYLYKRSGLTSSTYAASQLSGPVYGFSFLSPVYNIWTVSRNISYLLLILIILFTGIMIIVGGKVGGQVPITFMSALPNIMAAIVLITFSYAIGGFMIDLMNILLGLIYSIFTSLNTGSFNFPTAFSSRSYIFSVYGAVTGNNMKTALQGTGSVINNLPDGTGGVHYIFSAIGGIIHNGGAADSIIVFIVAVILLFTVFKIIIQLLKGYLIFLFLPIAAPFMFLLGSVPGQSKATWSFFKGMSKAILIYVVTYTMFNLIYYLQNSITGLSNGNTLPLLGLGSIFSSQQGNTIGLLISIALFVMIPKIIADATKALGYDFSSYATELKRGFAQPYSSLRKWTGNARKSLGS